MEKAIFYNMKDIFPAYEILNSGIFEPDFRDWSDDELERTHGAGAIFFYKADLDLTLIKSIRTSLHFGNTKLVYFCDKLDLHEKQEALRAGATTASLLPSDFNELTQIMESIKHSLSEAKNFNKDKLHPFMSAIEEVFATMAITSVEVVETYYCPEKFHYGEVTGIMSLAGKSKGAVVLTINEKFAKQVISNIMAIPTRDLMEEDVHDGVAELVNMIAGGAKARLSDTEEHFLISAPTIIAGDKYRVIQQKDMPCVVIVYRADEDYFAVQICLMTLGV